MPSKHVFVCYSSKDRKYVDGLKSISKNESNIDIWASDLDKVPVGDNYESFIKDKIKSSQGAILLVSQSFLDSDFINRVELPLIFECFKNQEFHLEIVLIEECDYKLNPYLNNVQFSNSESTTLNSLSSSLYSLVIKDLLNKFSTLDSPMSFESSTDNEWVDKLKEFYETSPSEKHTWDKEDSKKYKHKKSKLKNFLVTGSIIGFILLFTLLAASSLQDTSSNNKEASSSGNVNETSLNRGDEVFLRYLEAKMTNENVGDVILFSDYDFLSHANWVCALLNKGVQHYFIYDGLWFLVAEDLTKYNAGENMTRDQMWGAVYFIFHGANDYWCDSTVNTDQLENKFNFHKNLTSENYEWRSELFNSQFKEGYLKNLFELLNNSNPPLSLLGYFDSQDEFYDLMIMACETILPMEPMEYLSYVKERFSEAKNLEDQNVIWDFEEIILLGVPTWFCPDLIEKGNRLSTYIYLVDFKY